MSQLFQLPKLLCSDGSSDLCAHVTINQALIQGFEVFILFHSWAEAEDTDRTSSFFFHLKLTNIIQQG